MKNSPLVNLLNFLFFTETTGKTEPAPEPTSVSNPDEDGNEGSDSWVWSAVVSDIIQPKKPGRVRFQGSWWPAICRKNLVLKPGTLVQVVGRSNILLLVEPVSLDSF